MKFAQYIVFLLLSISTCFAVDESSTFSQCVAERKNSEEQKAKDNALLWYRTSAERIAIYEQTFVSAEKQIDINRKESDIKSTNWGIVVGLDGTLLDSSEYKYYQYFGCTNENSLDYKEFAIKNMFQANPGAANFTCDIQALGGKVFIVTNRDVGDEQGHDVMTATAHNLETQHICYDSIIYAQDAFDTNKNPRFNAISTGDYENITAQNPQPATKIIAYVGNDIEDFPNFKQNTAHNYHDDSDEFNLFGSEYFLLPNPLTGGWRKNYWK